ncbi:MAG: hypothetical protein WDM78_23775 [Puia sp.]
MEVIKVELIGRINKVNTDLIVSIVTVSVLHYILLDSNPNILLTSYFTSSLPYFHTSILPVFQTCVKDIYQYNSPSLSSTPLGMPS